MWRHVGGAELELMEEVMEEVMELMEEVMEEVMELMEEVMELMELMELMEEVMELMELMELMEEEMLLYQSVRIRLCDSLRGRSGSFYSVIKTKVASQTSGSSWPSTKAAPPLVAGLRALDLALKSGPSGRQRVIRPEEEMKSECIHSAAE
ncbi:uncharacterized protein V6R79_016114 [Siganus canaliculatus]